MRSLRRHLPSHQEYPRRSRLLGADKKPVPISDAEADRIKGQVQDGVERPKTSITFEVGENVRVRRWSVRLVQRRGRGGRRGPFAGQGRRVDLRSRDACRAGNTPKSRRSSRLARSSIRPPTWGGLQAQKRRTSAASEASRCRVGACAPRCAHVFRVRAGDADALAHEALDFDEIERAGVLRVAPLDDIGQRLDTTPVGQSDADMHLAIDPSSPAPRARR